MPPGVLLNGLTHLRLLQIRRLPHAQELVTTMCGTAFTCLAIMLCHLLMQVLRAPAEEPRGPAYLTFAVPPDVYTNFKQPRLKGPLSKEKFPIRQRVMRIPLMRMRALAFNPLAI